MPLTLVVLAAGIGSRYGGLKQIDPVGPSGEFVLDYSIFDAIRAGFDRVAFVIRRAIERDFRAAIGSRFEGRVSVEYVCQEMEDLPPGFSVPPGRNKPWGTAHAVRACRNLIGEPFASINADDFYGRESYRELAGFLRNLRPAEPRYGMVGFVLRNTLSEFGHVARAVCDVDSDGYLRSAVERTAIEKTATGARFLSDDGQWHDLTGGELVSMNMWGFTPAIFRQIEQEFPVFLSAQRENPKAEFFIPTVVDRLIREKKATVRVLPTPERWVGVTYPEDKPSVAAHVRRLVRSGVYPECLWRNGVA